MNKREEYILKKIWETSGNRNIVKWILKQS